MTFGSFEFKIEIMLQVEWEEEHFTIWLDQNIYQNLNCQVILYANIDFLVILLTIAAPSIFHETQQQ